MAAAKQATKTHPPDADKTPGKELVNQQTGEVITEADALSMYAEDAGAGFENQTSEDIGIPSLVLLQPLSPEVSAEGSVAKPGMWCLRGAGLLFEQGVSFIPVLTRHVFREWPSKDPSGGAPVADHDIASPMITKVRATQPFGDYTNPDNPDHPLIETFDVFGLTLTDDGAPVPSVVNFSSTHIRPYKDWMTKARTVMIDIGGGRKINPALFAHAYTFRSQRMEKKPHIWWVPAITWADAAGAIGSRLPATGELYAAAKSFREAVNSGAVRVAAQTRDAAGDESLKKGDTSQEKAPY